MKSLYICTSILFLSLNCRNLKSYVQILRTKHQIRNKNHNYVTQKSLSPTATSTLQATSKFVETVPTTTITIQPLPCKTKFDEYYNLVVCEGVMDKDQFLQYIEVRKLIECSLVVQDDVDLLWLNSVGDASGLNADEAYELLCMVQDLPDPDDVEYIDAEFRRLIGAFTELSFSKFLLWGDIQDMLSDDVLTMEEITSMWRLCAGDLNTPIKIDAFRRLNQLIDEALDNDGTDLSIYENVENGSDGSSALPESFFDSETLAEFQNFFHSNKDTNNKINYNVISKWSDITEMISDGVLTQENFETAWFDIAKGQAAINYDDYIRLNIRLDLLMSDVDSNSTANNNNEQEFYIAQFKLLMGDNQLMPFDKLCLWDEIIELLQERVISKKQLQALYDAMPKEIMGLPSTETGISLESFIKLNKIIDAYLQSTTSKQTKKMYNSLNYPTDSLPLDSNETVTESELELMNLLDNAENLLNSGNFIEFDKAIGDENDPRLLISKTPTSKVLSSNLMKDLYELVKLAKQQKRCGLDVPSELDNSLLQNSYQAVLQNCEPIVNRDLNEVKLKLNGKWNLLFTNSEMFRFYSGFTGFPNVFPATTFEKVAFEYSTDGYSNELKYIERLGNPFGGLEAVAYGNWDLVKETSFMTNVASLIIRAYCTKVTAGPMTYEAQENWKSLRTMSMNELVYLDEQYLIMRNCGALRIYFICEKI